MLLALPWHRRQAQIPNNVIPAFRFVVPDNLLLLLLLKFLFASFSLLTTMIFVEKVNTDRGELFIPAGSRPILRFSPLSVV